MKRQIISETRANTIRYYIDGKAIFPQIIDVIESAEKSIFVEVFLFYDDESGSAIARKLVEKANAGLDVRVLLSTKGTEFNNSYAIFDMFRKNNVKVVLTFPLPWFIKDICGLINWEQSETEIPGEKAWDCRVDESVNRKMSQRSQKILADIHRRCDQAPEAEIMKPRQLTRKRKKILRSVTYYDHRKVIIVDNKKVFMGGMNFGNDYLFQGKPSEFGYFHDIGITLTGEVVKEVLKLYMEVWHLFSREKTRLVFPGKMEAAGVSSAIAITTISSYPRKRPNQIRQAYLRETQKAEKSIYFINLYITDKELIRELINASRRGVEVHIISTFSPTKSDIGAFIRLLYKGYFYLIVYKAKMQRYGIKLHQYTKYNVHAKVGIVDDKWVTIGSSNLDYSSLRNALEINIVLMEQPFISKLKDALFQTDIKDSHILDKKLSFFQRIWYFICYKIFTLGEKYFI